MNQAEKWEEGEPREERAAAHGKHMSSRREKKPYTDAYTEEKRGSGGGGGFERRGGREGCEAGTG